MICFVKEQKGKRAEDVEAFLKLLQEDKVSYTTLTDLSAVERELEENTKKAFAGKLKSSPDKASVKQTTIAIGKRAPTSV